MPSPLRQITSNLWYVPADLGAAVQPNVGVISVGDTTVLVDAGNSPRHARLISRALADAGLPLVSHIIYTHHHWDHVFGAQVFVAPVIAHELCRDILIERAAHTWNNAFIEEDMRRNPHLTTMYANIQRVMDDWHGFHIVVPSMAFSGAMTVFLDGLTLDLEHVGGQHAPDSIVVKVREAGVAFIGDCYYKPVPLHQYPDSTPDAGVIRRLLADESVHTFIDGHTPALLSRADAMQYIQDL